MSGAVPPPRPGWPGWLVPLLLGAAVLALQAGGEPVRAALRYDRAAVLAGQGWRLLGAHFVHLGWLHCLLNVAGLALCAALSGRTHGARAWLAATLAIGAGVGAMLLALAPAVERYVGLSGVLYGLFLWGLAPRAWRGDRLAAAALLVVLVRVGWQLAGGPSPSEARLIGGAVLAQAHLYGLIGAAAWLAGSTWWARRRRAAG